MTLITFQDGKVVMRDGKVGTEQECCCDDGVCPPCNLPRFLRVTLSGFPDGYVWASINGGVPGAGGGFEPICPPGSNAGDPAIRLVGSSVGLSGYSSYRLRDLNDSFLVEFYNLYGEEFHCQQPTWYGIAPAEKVLSTSGECTQELLQLAVSLVRQDNSTTLSIAPPFSDAYAGDQAYADVSEVTDGAITDTTIIGPGSGYAYEETARSAPTLDLAVTTSTGSGAAFSITLTEFVDYNGDAIWGVDSISVTNAGSGYSLSDYASIVVTDGVESYPASITLGLTRIAPTIAVTVTSSTGAGAVLEAVLASATDFYGQQFWYVDSVTVVDGGTNYDPGDAVEFSVTSGTDDIGGSASGAISVTGGVIDSVAVYYGGGYADTDGTLASVIIDWPGEYYKETLTGNVIVDTPQVTVSSNTGSGAELEAVIDDDPASATFGEVTGLTIVSGGVDYAIDGQSWRIDFALANLFPLAGGGAFTPKGLVPGGNVCMGADLSASATAISERVDFSDCGLDLLDKSYDTFFGIGIFPFGVAGMDNAAQYSVSGPFFSPNNCDELRVVNFGGGGLSVTISPA